MNPARDAFADRLLDLAYGELSPREAREVEAHASSCEACRAELARIRATRSLMATLPDEPAPERGERVVLAAAREAAERSASRRAGLRWMWGTLALAASLVAVGAVSYRLLALRPGPLSSKPDDTALLGESRYTVAPPAPPAEAPRVAPAPQAAVGPAEAGPRADQRAEQRAERHDRVASAPAAPPAERKRAAPAPEERPSRAFAAAPPAPAETEAAPRQAAPGAGAEAAPAADAGAIAAPPPPAASAPLRREVEREGQGVRRSAPTAKAAPPPAASRVLAGEAAPLREETRRFERCDGEAVRRVEVDGGGRVIRYVREGTFGGRRLRVIQTFRPDGAPAGATAQDLDAGGAPVDPRALGVALVERAGDAGIDAPPRCGR